MKNILWILLLIVGISFGQNKHKPKHNNHHGHHNNHHNHHVQKPNYNFWFGLAVLDAVSGNRHNTYQHNYGWNENSVMELHFRYVPRRDEWVLQNKKKICRCIIIL